MRSRIDKMPTNGSRKLDGMGRVMTSDLGGAVVLTGA